MANLVEEDKVAHAKQIRNSSFDEDASICILTVMKLLRNILLSPTSETKYRSVPLANRAFHGKVGRVKGGIMVLEAVGFKRNNNKDTILLDNIDENKKEIWQAMKRLNVEADALNVPPTNRPIVPTEMDIRSASSNSNNNNNDNNASKNDQDEFVVVDEKKDVPRISIENVDNSIKQMSVCI